MNNETSTTGGYSVQPGNSGHPLVLGASTLNGNDVYNTHEENLGSIKEIMLDVHNGTVRYAVLSSGGFLGMGDKLFAIPWQALTIDTKNKRFMLDVAAERLKNAPGFDKDNWPDMADPTWTQDIHSYYNLSSPVTGRPNTPL